jgi:F0F1-type ATP synthase membrane subunit b/b'
MRKALAGRLVRVVLLVSLAAGMAFAAEKEAKGEDDGLAIWRTANFVVLVLGLGYLARKFGGPFLAARAENMRRAKADAQAVRRDAEEKAAAVDARLANLEADIGALREESEREMKTESERLAQATAAALAKVEASVQREIGAATKAATFELKRHSARLALELAEHKVRARLNPQTEDALVQGFVSDLRRRSAPASSN